MYEYIKTFSIVITFFLYLTINAYVFYEIVINLFKSLPKKTRFAFTGLSFLISPILIYIGLLFDSHFLWATLHIISYSYLIYLNCYRYQQQIYLFANRYILY